MQQKVMCPECKKVDITGKRYGSPGISLSRKDNKTLVCAECGKEEALDDFVRGFFGLPKRAKA